MAKFPGKSRSLECRARSHKGETNYPLAWKCPKCERATCCRCNQVVYPADTAKAERRAMTVGLLWLAVPVAGAILWWSPWDTPPAPRSSSLTYNPDPHIACQSAYEDDSNLGYVDPEEIKAMPGCSGWLPPPPQMLPGYDQDCDDLTHLGPVNVDTSDRYDLDADGDGIGCEPHEF